MEIVIKNEDNEEYYMMENHGVLIYFNTWREVAEGKIVLLDEMRQDVGKVYSKEAVRIFHKRIKKLKELF